MSIHNVICVALAAAGMALAPALRAEVLYFMIDDAQYTESSGKTGDADFDYATVSADNGSSYLNIYDESGDTGYSRLYYKDGDANSSYPAGVNVTGLSGNLMLQLWDDNSSLLGWQYLNLSALSDFIWSEGASAKGGAQPYSVSQIVPEPTSGLLLLLGAAGLALRRRRMARA